MSHNNYARLLISLHNFILRGTLLAQSSVFLGPGDFHLLVLIHYHRSIGLLHLCHPFFSSTTFHPVCVCSTVHIHPPLLDRDLPPSSHPSPSTVPHALSRDYFPPLLLDAWYRVYRYPVGIQRDVTGAAGLGIGKEDPRVILWSCIEVHKALEKRRWLSLIGSQLHMWTPAKRLHELSRIAYIVANSTTVSLAATHAHVFTRENNYMSNFTRKQIV